jgi:hypothetical protein
MASFTTTYYPYEQVIDMFDDLVGPLVADLLDYLDYMDRVDGVNMTTTEAEEIVSGINAALAGSSPIHPIDLSNE